MKIPHKYLDLLENPNIAHLATASLNSKPQVTPVWFLYNKKENTILINTAKGRIKYKNMVNNPLVAISIVDTTNKYRYISIQAKIVEIDENNENGLALANKLSYFYRNSKWIENSKEIRVNFTLMPVNVHIYP